MARGVLVDHRGGSLIKQERSSPVVVAQTSWRKPQKTTQLKHLQGVNGFSRLEYSCWYRSWPHQPSSLPAGVPWPA